MGPIHTVWGHVLVSCFFGMACMVLPRPGMAREAMTWQGTAQGHPEQFIPDFQGGETTEWHQCWQRLEEAGLL